MNNLDQKRHSLAHLLAATVLDQYPEAKPTLGPAVENGFYYDFDFGDNPPSDKDLKVLEKKMKKTLPQWDVFQKIEVSADEARQIFADNPYKLELIDEISGKGEDVTLYYSGPKNKIPSKEEILDPGFRIPSFSPACATHADRADKQDSGFLDLCRGGHVDDFSEIDPQSFTLSHLAGAYWRGDENNKMLTRIYGLAFENAEELAHYIKQREEAKKRDHKKLGKEMGFFAFSDLVGPGLPMLLPKGEIIKTELEKYIRQEKEALGYDFVSIPHIAKTALYEKSGHLGKYDAMMPIMTDENGDQYVLKAMNCPHHFELYRTQKHSYRDLPLRYAENTSVYRNEKSGELSGLLRVKAITQDDTHHFVRHDQIKSEIQIILAMIKRVYDTFQFTDYSVQISVRDPKAPEKYFGDHNLWEKAEQYLKEAIKEWGTPYLIEEGEAAFYGPKIDIMVRDSLGRTWQLATVQMDFTQPDNFDLTYIGEDGHEHQVAVLHVAIFGSFERFMGVIIEHFGGAFPLWLSPVQVKILPISDKHSEHANRLARSLKQSNLRVEVDERTESVGKKIREAEKQKTPYMLIVGDKEVEADTVSVRARGEQDLGTMDLETLTKKLLDEIEEKYLKS